MRDKLFWLGAAALILGAILAPRFISNQYYYVAGYVVLQYVALSTAWNILGGYTGYVNFGSAAFFALGAYSTVALAKLVPPSAALSGTSWELLIVLYIVAGAIVSGLVGLATGYLTLRLRGVFFSIATLALSVVLQTLIVNWDFVGGSRGAYMLPPRQILFFDNYVQYLFVVMMVLAVGSVAVARFIERSWLGRGLAAIRDDEQAAVCSGVPTLRLKIVAAAVSGLLMGAAGAPLPYRVTYLDPASGFDLAYAVNSIAMPLIGGTMTWSGPVIGALLLGTAQQIATVTISSALNLLIVGVLLVFFVIVAPGGIVGLVRRLVDGRRR